MAVTSMTSIKNSLAWCRNLIGIMDIMQMSFFLFCVFCFFYFIFLCFFLFFSFAGISRCDKGFVFWFNVYFSTFTNFLDQFLILENKFIAGPN